MSTTQNESLPVGNPQYETHDHATGVRNGVAPNETNGFNTNANTNAPVVNRNHKAYDYGGNPLAHTNTGESARFPAFGGELQPGLYKPTTGRKFANPAPLGLSAFALTTFVPSLVNLQTDGVTKTNIVVASAFGYVVLPSSLRACGMFGTFPHDTFFRS